MGDRKEASAFSGLFGGANPFAGAKPASGLFGGAKPAGAPFGGAKLAGALFGGAKLAGLGDKPKLAVNPEPIPPEPISPVVVEDSPTSEDEESGKKRQRRKKPVRHHSIPNPSFERFCMIFGTELAKARPDLTQEELLNAMKVMYVNQPEWMQV